jgi:tetratricopeptide (TPR) repeat protein
VAYELSFHGLMQGAFTHALAEVITRTEITSGGALIDEVRREMADGPVSDRPQTAQLIGSRSQPLLAGSFPAADLWRQARRRTVPPDEIPQLRRVADPLARWTIGRSLLAHGDLVMGRVELEAALNGLPNPPASLLIDLAIAALDLDDPDAAVKALRRAGSAALVTAALAALAAPTLPPAVLVIVTDPEQFPAETITGLLRTVPLLATADTIVVAGRDAIRDRVLSEASACAQQTSQRLAVCVVLGTFSEYGPTQVLHVADGLLRMTDLAAALQTPTPEDAGNLVVLLDRLTSLTSVARDLAVVHAVPEVVLPGTIVKVDEISPDRAALRSLVASGDFPTELAASATAGQGRRVLRDRTAMITARRILVAARHAAAAAAVVRATSEIARRKVRHDSYPEGYLQRGLALEQCGREAEALADLRVARNLYEDDDVWQVEVHRDRSAEEWRRQARYHFGRAQLRYGDDLAEAVGALRAAERQDPGNPRVLRTLALAIRALIEQDVLVEGSGYLARYLNAGAPQGAEPELLDFYLRQRNR